MNNLAILPTAPQNTLGQRIKLARQASVLSQNKLAQRLNVSITAVANWERDEKRPREHNIRKVADATNVSYEFLVAGILNSKPESEPAKPHVDQTLHDIILSLDASKDLPASVVKMLQQVATRTA